MAGFHRRTMMLFQCLGNKWTTRVCLKHAGTDAGTALLAVEAVMASVQAN